MSDPKSSPSSDQKSSGKKSSKKEQPLADLSALSFGPAWAKEKPKRDSAPRRKDSGSDEKKFSGRKQNNRRPDGKGDRRNQFQGRGRKPREHRERRPVIEAPEGVKARIMPIEEGLDALAKQISDTGRTHGVFDLAWLVLGGLERFHVIFEREKEPLYQSNSDHSLWLTKQECLSHFWANKVAEKYYDESVSEVDAPTGNFQSVARCGLSRTLIGPPNHHAYQETILELHRAKFSNMSLESYKQKITMENGEEVVQEWLESMKKQIRWQPKVVVETAEADAGDKPEEESTPTSDETVVELTSRREVEQHFLLNGFEKEYESGNIMSVRANIAIKLISPSLLVLQKNTVAEARKYPGDLASILCRQMSGRHLAVFKWKKRLHCGPARPKHVPEDLVMADRPSALFKWVSANPAGNIDAMWKDLLAEDVDEKTRHLWYHDLHWLINEGFALLFADGKLHAAKELDKPAAPVAKKAAKPKKEAAPKADSAESKEGK